MCFFRHNRETTEPQTSIDEDVVPERRKETTETQTHIEEDNESTNVQKSAVAPTAHRRGRWSHKFYSGRRRYAVIVYIIRT